MKDTIPALSAPKITEEYRVRFEKMSEMERYSELVEIRDLLKYVQQLSWNINNAEKKFPLESLLDSDYDELLKIYIKFGEEVNGIAHEFREKIY